MNISPYSTLAAGHTPLQSIKTELAKAATLGELSYDYDLAGSEIVLVVGAKDATCVIPPFSHPIEFERADGETRLAVDVRSCTSVRKSIEERHVVRNRSEYSLMIRRAILQKAWNDGAYDDLRNISPLGAQVFARWLPESITRAFGLDPAVQLELSVLTAFYYFCLFEPDTAAPQRERGRFITQVARATSVSYERVEEILHEIRHLGTLKEYCACVKERNLSVRLERFEPAVVMQLVVGSWFGTQAREIVAVSLEHPPTFLCLLYAAITDRSYYKTKLSELVNRSFNKGDALRVYEINFNRCVDVWR